MIARFGGRSRDDAQAIIAELVGTTSQYRKVSSIAGGTHLPERFVEAVLNHLCDDRTVGPVRAWTDEWGYTLFTRRPGFVRRSC